MSTQYGVLVVAAGVAVASFAACDDGDNVAGYVYNPIYGYDTLAADDTYYDAAVAGGAYAGRGSVLPASVRLLLARWNASIDDPTCIAATASGDEDDDGIDSNATLDLDCNSTDANRSATVTGRVVVQDANDGAGDAGYTLTFDHFSVNVTGNSTLSRVVSGTATYQKVSSNPLQYSLTRDTTVTGTDLYADGVTRHGTFAMNGTGTFTPAIVTGSPVITQGTLSLAGQGTFTDVNGVVDTIIRQTIPSLHWNSGCGTQARNEGFDAGAIVYQSTRGVQTSIVYSSCTALTVTRSIVPAEPPS
jgi:hypothetical protein